MAFAAKVRRDAGRSEPFEVVAPLAMPAGVSADELIASAGRWQTAGATAFHVGVIAREIDELVERLAWFGRHVIPAVS